VKVLITGAAGFVGQGLAQRIQSTHLLGTAPVESIALLDTNFQSRPTPADQIRIDLYLVHDHVPFYVGDCVRSVRDTKLPWNAIGCRKGSRTRATGS